MQVKLSNAGMQYLYSIVLTINLNTRQAVKNVTNILDIIRPVVSEYEKQMEEGKPAIVGKLQIIKDKKQMHEAKLRAARIIAAGEKMTEESVKPYDTKEEEGKVAEEIATMEKETEQLKEERTALANVQVSAVFNEEQFNALNMGVDAALAFQDPKTGLHLFGEENAVGFREVIEAIENAEKI